MGTHSKAVRGWIGVLAALVLTVTACTSGTDEEADPGGARGTGGVVGISSSAPTLLRSGNSCDEVVAGFRSLATENMAAGIPFGRTGLGDFATEDAAESTAAGDGDDAALSPVAADAESSDTNTQEAGIDEPDLVETDGEYVYLIDQSGESEHLVILDGATAAVLSRVDLASWGNTMLLSGDRLLVISSGGYGFAEPFVVEDVAAEPADGGGEDGSEPADPPADEPGDEPVDLPRPTEPPSFDVGTTLQLFDVADPAAPRLVESTEVEGSHTSTRVVDGVARVVIASYPQVYPAEETLERIDFDDQDAVAEATETAIEDAELSDWLPSFRTSTPTDDGDVTTTDGELVECDQVLLPDVNAGTGETSVLRVDFEAGVDPSATTTVVADAHTVYASAQTLYIAATRAVPAEAEGGDVAIDIAPEDWSTAIHAFDLTGDGAAVHAAAGEVPGNLLNQYSLSEYDGDLRVATTEGAPWGPQADSESGVRVLQRDGDRLVEIGAVTGLGKTETIQSVRFMGETGYVVTFRQTDPLYVIDLSDPTNPTAVGELKIPGFSSYLHPVGEGRLVGIGRDADPETGEDRGFLLSLFDVSDPTAPTQIQTYTDPTLFSSAGFDPKAFLWWENEGVVAVPYERYDDRAIEEIDEEGEFVEPDYETGILVLDVADDGITERGSITTTSGSDGYTSWTRALVVQDSLWGIYSRWEGSTSGSGVAVAEFDDIGGATFHPFG